MKNLTPIFRLRRDTAAEWVDANTVLDDGEPAYDKTNRGIKIGDGVTPWNELPWVAKATDDGEEPEWYTKPATGIPASDLDVATQTRLDDALLKSGNLLGLADKAVSRTNLGLGGASTLDVGTAAGTVAAGDDSRFTNTRTPTDNTVTKAKLTANLIPYDFSFLAVGPANGRTVGAGDNPLGVRIPRAITVQGVYYRCSTPDASGTMAVELRRNGAQIAGTSLSMVSTAQTAGVGATGLSVALAAGDILTVQITAVGTTPGKGLVADITAAWT
ncbi:hypothetical protein SEA_CHISANAKITSUNE_28 [Gordonia phage ChisanaKitsune]|uniref:Major tropism determinant N-terminal domain-containing protein n=1 Tax=Gordonia phage ChisanaKitsune TaxID=2871538 RepID=A0AAE8C187_9CAUD|nr:hydrolase [Gordonia phage ChisanaKitsune]QZE10797.1 hypothetical protein SEA_CHISANAKITSUNE_28 [Gordonia phage ChisanaKitsune]